jgi:ligand-binding SRPBCC domain-containing protein
MDAMQRNAFPGRAHRGGERCGDATQRNAFLSRVVLIELRGTAAMPVFESSQVFPLALEEVFDFFIQPANLVKVSPPELSMKLTGGPERLALGSCVTLDGRRWGIAQRIVSEVIDFQPGVTFTDAQTKGPFRKWVHRHTFATVPGGTEVKDRIEYEPPGGMLGLVATVTRIDADLKWVFGFRQKQLARLLGEPSAPQAPTSYAG